MSVIVPCYDYAHFLEGCVESVLSQDGVDVRVLIIDDASNDCSAKVAAELAARDGRIEARSHRDNRGHIATYNEGLWWAEGDYTVLLSADDRLVTGALGRATAVLDAHPHVGFVYGRRVTFSSDDARPAVRTTGGSALVYPGRDWIAQRCKRGHNCIASPEVVVRTSVQQRAGGYRAELPHSGDLEMWMRLAALADVGYVKGADQAYYRVHPASMQQSRFINPIDDLRQRRAAFDSFFATNAVRDGSRLHSEAMRTLARDALWRACRAFDAGRLGSTPVDDLVAFASDAFPDASSLHASRALRLRSRLGPRLSARLLPLHASPALRRLRIEMGRWQWARSGV